MPQNMKTRCICFNTFKRECHGCDISQAVNSRGSGEKKANELGYYRSRSLSLKMRTISVACTLVLILMTTSTSGLAEVIANLNQLASGIASTTRNTAK